LAVSSVYIHNEYKDVSDELIQGQDFNVVECKVLGRKIPDVLCHDHFGFRFDGGGKHMAIIRIGQAQSLLDILQASYDSFWKCSLNAAALPIGIFLAPRPLRAIALEFI
jgi:hypothetical protein